MDSLDALLLGLTQGLTEFLPISSSAHLKLVKFLLGVEEGESQLLFDLFCHFGTLVALLYSLRNEIGRLFSSDRRRLLLFFLALVPLIPFYFLLKPVREFASQPQYLGFCLWITGSILWVSSRWRLRTEPGRPWQDALWIGTLQAAALIPGISRSASTISAARVLGWQARDAVYFSFLLSIPTIIGGICLELLKLSLTTAEPVTTITFSSCLIGFLSSCGVGLFVIGYALRWLEQGNLRPFAWYCFAIGAIAWMMRALA